MQKSVLIQILAVFSKKEWRDMEKWLNSPIHNQRSDVQLLFEHIRTNWSTKAELEKEISWSLIFPKEPYDDARMRQVIYFLTSAVEDFVAYSEIMRDPIQVKLMLAGYFRGKKAEKPFKKTTTELRKKIEAQPLRNQTYLEYIHRLENELYDYDSVKYQKEDLHLQETSDALDSAYIAAKLRNACAMLAHKSVNKKVDYDAGLLEKVLSYVEENALLDQPVIAVYYYAYKSGTEEERPEFFQKLLRFIEQAENRVTEVELREVYRIALNYCIRKVNKSELNYAHHAMELYKNGIQKGVLLDKGRISRYTFFNTIASALKVGAYEWAEDFVEKNQRLLAESHQRSTVEFNLARIYFEKEDYDQAQKLLVHYEYDDLLLNLVAKTMLLKIYYAEGELDALESLIGSMGAYLKRKESLDDNRRIGYKNFLKIIKKIINLSPSAKAAREKIQRLIQDTQPLMEREWLRGLL